ncbi:YidB family protein [Granulosicoccaceae sp. 1_MG-2023]|nr:YidB family protein [Granulosicoccaceae sp. 1_MG-2023]
MLIQTAKHKGKQIMDLMKLGTELLMNKLNVDADGDGNPDGIMGALSGLIGGGDGNLDLAGIVSKMQGNGGDLSGMLSSWLGDGENAPISASQVTELFGSDKVADFASQLNLDQDTAAEKLSEALPEIVDKSSSGGSLLDSVGGLSGALDMAKKFL